MRTTVPEHVDVLIVGAGLSGIGAACHLRRDCPDRSFALLEARAATGGTWDLFRYPGIRSDSDMHTLGYSFRPWGQAKTIAEGASILQYIRETAAEYGVVDRIHCGHRVDRGELEQRGRELDGDRRADRHRRDGPADVLVRAGLHRLLPL